MEFDSLFAFENEAMRGEIYFSRWRRLDGYLRINFSAARSLMKHLMKLAQKSSSVAARSVQIFSGDLLC